MNEYNFIFDDINLVYFAYNIRLSHFRIFLYDGILFLSCDLLIDFTFRSFTYNLDGD